MGASSAEPPDPTVVAELRAAGCVFAEEEASLLQAEAGSTEELASLLARRVAGEPLEQVLGWAEFGGLRIAVAPGVFVPRRRTALLAELAVQHALRTGTEAIVVDLCCGTGAIGAVVAARVPDAELHAADIDPDAVACARANLRGQHVHQGDLYDALPPRLRGRVDVLAVNAPYVPTDEIARMPTEARDHEHRVALDGGPDGLVLHRRVAADAAEWLAPGGVLLLETSRHQREGTLEACRSAGFAPEVVTREEAMVVRAAADSITGARSGTMNG